MKRHVWLIAAAVLAAAGEIGLRRGSGRVAPPPRGPTGQRQQS
jgi:hypothetical protein